MKVNELITELQKYTGDTEIYFASCCYPMTKWFTVDDASEHYIHDGDGQELVLDGYRGSYVAGDPDESPFVQTS